MEAPYHLCGQRFERSAEIEVSLHAHAASQGYALVRQRTTYNRTGLHKIWMVCDRNNGRRSTASERRTASRGTSCPMRVAFTRVREPQSLQDHWVFEVLNGSHNHTASLAKSAHPQYRRLALTSAVKQTILSASAAAVSPRQVLALIRQSHAETPLQSRDIYNALEREKLVALRGKSRLESLVDDLNNSNWTWALKTGETGEISHFFFATPASIELLRDYPEVLLMDCTYKTNRFGMPLLVVVGVSPLLTTFYAAFAFVRGEKEDDYAWALAELHKIYARQLGRLAGPTTVLTDRDLALSNALAAQWPLTTHVLCIWHINKGVVTNCKKFFETKEAWDAFFEKWHATWRAVTVEDGLAAWRDLIARYGDRYASLVRYLETTWIPLKKKFWVSYTNKVFTLGNRATSRVEGAHAGLKAWLQTSQGDLKKVKESTELLLVAQQEGYKGQLAAAAMRTPHQVNVPAFHALIGHVTPAALQLMLPQLRLAKSGREEDRKPCTKVFRTTMGLPCSHVMRDRFESNGVLLPNDLHPFWSMRPSRSPPEGHPRPFRPLLNPATPRALRETAASHGPARTQGTPASSTRRDTCSFERAERAFEQRARRQSRARTSRKVTEYHPTRLSRVTGETVPSETAAPAGDVQDKGLQSPQLSQSSRVSLVSRSQVSEVVRASQLSQVSEFLKELPESADPTTAAIAAALSQARRALGDVDRLVGKRACDIPLQSVEDSQAVPAAVSPPHAVSLESSPTAVSQPMACLAESGLATARQPKETSPTEPAVFRVPRGGNVRTPTPLSPTLEAKVAAAKAIMDRDRLAPRAPALPGFQLQRVLTASEELEEERREQEEENRIYEIELKRLIESGGEAEPLWASMAEFGGFGAARAYNSRPQGERREARCETLPPSEGDPDEVREADETAAALPRRSARVKRPSHRVNKDGEKARLRSGTSSVRGSSMRARETVSRASKITVVTSETTRAGGASTVTSKGSTKGKRRKTRAN